MPVVRVSWFEGKDTPTKQAVASEITGSIVRNTGTAPKYIYVIFEDVAPSDWAGDDKLFASWRRPPPRHPRARAFAEHAGAAALDARCLSVTILHGLGNRAGVIESLEGLAGIAKAAPAQQRAARLWSAADAL